MRRLLGPTKGRQKTGAPITQVPNLDIDAKPLTPSGVPFTVGANEPIPASNEALPALESPQSSGDNEGYICLDYLPVLHLAPPSQSHPPKRPQYIQFPSISTTGTPPAMSDAPDAAANPQAHALERADLHKILKAFEGVLINLNEYCELRKQLAKCEKKLSKSVVDLGKSKAIEDVPSRTLQSAHDILECIHDVSTKQAKLAQKEYDALNEHCAKYFKRIAKEERAVDQNLDNLENKIRKAHAGYEKAVRRSGRAAIEFHEKYIEEVNSLTGEVKKVKADHGTSIGNKTFIASLVAATTLGGLADAEFKAECERVRKAGPSIGSLNECLNLAVSEATATIKPPDLEDDARGFAQALAAKEAELKEELKKAEEIKLTEMEALRAKAEEETKTAADAARKEYEEKYQKEAEEKKAAAEAEAKLAAEKEAAEKEAAEKAAAEKEAADKAAAEKEAADKAAAEKEAAEKEAAAKELADKAAADKEAAEKAAAEKEAADKAAAEKEAAEKEAAAKEAADKEAAEKEAAAKEAAEKKAAEEEAKKKADEDKAAAEKDAAAKEGAATELSDKATAPADEPSKPTPVAAGLPKLDKDGNVVSDDATGTTTVKDAAKEETSATGSPTTLHKVHSPESSTPKDSPNGTSIIISNGTSPRISITLQQLRENAKEEALRDFEESKKKSAAKGEEQGESSGSDSQMRDRRASMPPASDPHPPSHRRDLSIWERERERERQYYRETELERRLAQAEARLNHFGPSPYRPEYASGYFGMPNISPFHLNNAPTSLGLHNPHSTLPRTTDGMSDAKSQQRLYEPAVGSSRISAQGVTRTLSTESERGFVERMRARYQAEKIDAAAAAAALPNVAPSRSSPSQPMRKRASRPSLSPVPSQSKSDDSRSDLHKRPGSPQSGRSSSSKAVSASQPPHAPSCGCWNCSAKHYSVKDTPSPLPVIPDRTPLKQIVADFAQSWKAPSRTRHKSIPFVAKQDSDPHHKRATNSFEGSADTRRAVLSRAT